MGTFVVPVPLSAELVSFGSIGVMVVIVIAVGLYFAFRPIRHKYTGELYKSQRKIKGGALALLLIMTLLVAFVSGVFDPPPTIAVNGDQLVVSAPPFVSRTVYSNMVQGAYIGSIDYGNTTLYSRCFPGANCGTESLGDYELGQFKLSNGAPTYVASSQNENVVLRLSDGSYLVLSPSDFGGFVSELENTFLNHTIPAQS